MSVVKNGKSEILTRSYNTLSKQKTRSFTLIVPLIIEYTLFYIINDCIVKMTSTVAESNSNSAIISPAMNYIFIV